MAEFASVETIADFRTLDEGEVLEGYLDGVSGGAAPGSGHSRSYFHGWRNGMIESEREVPDPAYLQLAREFEHLSVRRH
jgi:hypothetical protein